MNHNLKRGQYICLKKNLARPTCNYQEYVIQYIGYGAEDAELSAFSETAGGATASTLLLLSAMVPM